MSSLVFVGSGGASCFFDEDVHTFTPSFMISTRLLILHLCIPISYSSLLFSLIYCGMLALKFELEVLLVARLIRVVYSKTGFFEKGLDVPDFLLFLVFFLYSDFQLTLHSASKIGLILLYLWIDIFDVHIIHPDNGMFFAWNQRVFGYSLLHHHFEPQCHICPY